MPSGSPMLNTVLISTHEEDAKPDAPFAICAGTSKNQIRTPLMLDFLSTSDDRRGRKEQLTRSGRICDFDFLRVKNGYEEQ